MFYLAPRQQLAVRLLSAVVCLLLVCFEAQAQDELVPEQTVPPPIKYISESERTKLDGARDEKSRARLGLELADERLLRAAQLTEAQSYNNASTELGIYQALVDDVMNFLRKSGKVRNKLRDIYKRLELTLRGHGSRLEGIRRVTPSEHAIHVRTIFDHTKRARTEALNAFFGDNVVSDANEEEDGKVSNNKVATDPPPESSSKQDP